MLGNSEAMIKSDQKNAFWQYIRHDYERSVLCVDWWVHFHIAPINMFKPNLVCFSEFKHFQFTWKKLNVSVDVVSNVSLFSIVTRRKQADLYHCGQVGEHDSCCKMCFLPRSVITTWATADALYRVPPAHNNRLRNKTKHTKTSRCSGTRDPEEFK